MKFALSLLLLVAYANAGPIPTDKQQSALPVKPTTVIVGSSQVDGKSGGKVTLHLDQRSQIGVDAVPVSASGSTSPVVQASVDPKPVSHSSAPSVPVNEPKPVLTGRNEAVVPVKSVEKPVVQITEVPKTTQLTARNEVNKAEQNAAVLPKQTLVAVAVPAVQQQVIPKEVSLPAKPVVHSEIVPEAQGLNKPVEPVVPVQVKSEKPQTQAESVVKSEPTLEVRSTQVQGQSVVVKPEAGVRQPSVQTQSTQDKPQPSQVQSRNTELPAKKDKVVAVEKVDKTKVESRNLKVDQTPVKAPIVVQKQVQSTQEVKSETKPQPTITKPIVSTPLQGKNAAVSTPEVPVVVKSEPVAQSVPVQPIAPIQPVQLKSDSVQSVQSLPVQAIQSAPLQPVPVQPVPVQPVPVQPVPVQPVPVQPVLVQSAPVQSVPIVTIPVQSVPVLKQEQTEPVQSVRTEVPQNVDKKVEPVVEQLSSVQTVIVPPKSETVAREDLVKSVVSVPEKVQQVQPQVPVKVQFVPVPKPTSV